MRLERQKPRLLILALLGVVLAPLWGTVNGEMADVQPPWSASVPRSAIVFGGSDSTAPVKPRVIFCMLNRFSARPGKR
jgi:hypothetical protein